MHNATGFNGYTSYSRYSMLVVVLRESSSEYEQYAIRSSNQTTRIALRNENEIQ